MVVLLYHYGLLRSACRSILLSLLSIIRCTSITLVYMQVYVYMYTPGQVINPHSDGVSDGYYDARLQESRKKHRTASTREGKQTDTNQVWLRGQANCTTYSILATLSFFETVSLVSDFPTLCLLYILRLLCYWSSTVCVYVTRKRMVWHDTIRSTFVYLVLPAGSRLYVRMVSS